MQLIRLRFMETAVKNFKEFLGDYWKLDEDRWIRLRQFSQRATESI